MLPRALLFSSDPQVTELILSLLPEFGVEVEHSRDVFGAIERLTSRSYQVIVVDWKEALEASFLLKTTRELSVAKSTPAVAVVEEKEVSGALNGGASVVLIKPLAFEQARRTFIAALPHICAEQSAPAQDAPRQVPSPTTNPAPVPVFREPTLDLSAIPKRRSSVAVPKLPTFAGYAQEPRRSSKHRTKTFTFGLLSLLVVGLLLARGAHFRTELVKAIRVSKFALASRSRPLETSADATAPVAPDDEAAHLSSIQAEPRTSGKLPRRGTLEVFPSSAPFSRSVPLPAHASGNPVTSAADPELKLVRPEIPPSLMVPVQAMTTHSPETRLSPSPANKWSAEPILLPENVSRDLLVRQVVPKYPELAVAAGVQGSVLLHAFVGKDGSIQDLKLISGPLVLGRAAFESVKQWRYRPYRMNGQMVEMQTFITVNFLRTRSTAVAEKLP